MTVTANIAKPMRGRTVFLYFVAFFGIITAVDVAFVYTALHTNTGVVTEQAYEKGLAFNQTLSKARNQPDMIEKPVYQNGVFRWNLQDKNGKAVTAAIVNIRFIRPVQDGQDFDMPMTETENGVYEARPTFPAKGLWTARLSAQWDSNKQFQTSHDFVAK